MAAALCRATVSAELDIQFVLDNYATHKAPPVKAWLAHHPRYHLYFTPTSASSLNQVERWFALLADKQIKRGVHRSARSPSQPARGGAAGCRSPARVIPTPIGIGRTGTGGFVPRRPATSRQYSH
jgi:hypothetical protein